MLVLFSLNANNIWFGLDFVVVLMWSDQEVLIVFDSWIRPKSAVEYENWWCTTPMPWRARWAVGSRLGLH